MINKQLFDVCEELGWMVYEDDDMIELQMFSPAGEDFSFSVDKIFFCRRCDSLCRVVR